MLPLRPDVPEVSPGDRITAEQQNKLIGAAVRSVSGGDFFSNRHGTVMLGGGGGGGGKLVAFQIDGAYTNATVLDCTLGIWNSATHNYAYTGDAAKCIDRRQNVPDADSDATGVGYWMPSDDHGQIIFVVDLDCPA